MNNMYEDIKPTVRIGKNGISDATIKEIKAQLKTRKVVKIKFLQSSDRSELKDTADKLAEKCGATVEKVIGFTVVLKRK